MLSNCTIHAICENYDIQHGLKTFDNFDYG